MEWEMVGTKFLNIPNESLSILLTFLSGVWPFSTPKGFCRLAV